MDSSPFNFPSSSSPQVDTRSTLQNPRNPSGLRLQPNLLPPSSPAVGNGFNSGEISPSFDASFASSMSIADSQPLENSKKLEQSSPFRMDISPAPTKPLRIYAPNQARPSRQPLFERTFTQPLPPSTNYPFLQNLFQSNEAFSTVERIQSPDSYIPPHGGHRIEKFATLPLPKALRHFPFEFQSTLEHHQELTTEHHGVMAPPPVPIPTSSIIKHHTAPSISLHAPAMIVKRFSDSDIPTISRLVDSSPAESNGMELDTVFGSPPQRRSSPRSLSDSYLPLTSPMRTQEPDEEDLSLSGASDRLADLFTDDYSPIRVNTRKRFLNLENSPTPMQPSSSSLSAVPAPPFAGRRSFEKASSISSMSAVSRRRTSGTTILPPKSISKRPSLASVKSAAMEQALAKVINEESLLKISGNYKRFAQVSGTSDKPVPVLKMMRRAHSVMEVIGVGPLSSLDGNVLGANSSNLVNRSSTKADGYFSTQSHSNQINENENSAMVEEKINIGKRPVERGSPLTGFRTQEEKGKALPCFGVKEDGLMRITADTLNDLLSGHYSKSIPNFSVIDCRFSYEFSGGHIISAINLPTVVDVESDLLSNCSNLPVASTSEEVGVGKRVLIFHCEFSAKRAPTSAKHLRSKDRLLNIAAYPNIHYPEVYVLQGGYLEFWKRFPALCEGPAGYISMDDPSHLEKRSIDLNAFRQQQGKRGFNRAKSFTFGESTGSSLSNGTRPGLGRQNSNSNLLGGAFIFPKNPKNNQSNHPKSQSATNSTTSSLLLPFQQHYPDSQNMVETLIESETITEEFDLEGDSSFQSSSGSSPCSSRISLEPKSSKPGGSGHDRSAHGSPCPMPPPKINMLGGPRRGLNRAQTSSSILFGR